MLARDQQVWRELLSGAEDGQGEPTTVRALTERLGLKRSTVYKALLQPRVSGWVSMERDDSELRAGLVALLDREALQHHWGARRHVERDVVLAVRTGRSIAEIESRLPRDAVLTGTLGYFRVTDSAVDAGRQIQQIWCYGDAAVILRAIPGESTDRAGADLVILNGDPLLQSFATGERSRVAPLCQIHADLYGIPGSQQVRQLLNARFDDNPVEAAR